MRLNRNDRLLLESLDGKYGKDLLINTLIQIANGVTPTTTVENVSTPKEAVLRFIQYIEGVRIRMREIHWETTNDAKHRLTNDYIDKLESYEDELAEDLMGTCGFRIKVGEVIPLMPKSTDLCSLMKEVLCAVINLIASLEGIVEFKGIVSVLDNISHDLSKGEFLETME